MAMNEPIVELVGLLRGMWRFRWPAAIAAWVIALLAWAFVWTLPNRYESHARVYVDTEIVLKPLLQGLAVNTDTLNESNMMATVLMSRPNLERVARDTDLHLRAKTPEDFERMVRALPEQIGLVTSRDKTYTISFGDTDPRVAQSVVSRLVNTFVEETRGDKRADSASAQQFLERQISEYEVKLRGAEERLAEFKKKNIGVMPGAEGDYYTRLQTDITALQELRSRQRQLTERRDSLARQIEGEEPTFGIFVSRTGPNDSKIAELRRRLEQLSITYTEKHPDIVAIQQQIAQLERDNANASSSGSSYGPADPATAGARALDINPVYQNLKISLAQTEAELAELRGQIAERSGRVGSLRSRVDVIPEVEAELSRLNRDYEVNRAQYTALVQRLESARISESADETTESVRMRIIDPPVIPLAPSGPPRALFFWLSTFLALAIGGALAFGLHLIRRVYSSRREITQATGLRVLGSISRVESLPRAAWWQRPRTVFACTIGALFLGLAGNLFLAR
jgi:polysaccharide chain length determinant protein (PEP-CTERM system associated)